ncbi:hypothetical protein ABW20_dc0102245 [Dactylellina cionopaga]|nr:hypothetical protein ABW20_dc0102245 [Dactylellina cionopaga]
MTTFSPSPSVPTLVETINNARLYSSSLDSFPNIIGVHIPYAVPANLHWILPAAILSRISSYPWFDNLKALSVETTLIDPARLSYDELNNIANLLPEKTAKFLASILQSHVMTKPNVIPFPECLEHVFTSDLQDSRHSFDFRAVALGDHNSRLVPPAAFFHHSATTLRSLKLKTVAIVNTEGQLPFVSYPTVETLHVILYCCSHGTIFELAVRFPHVSDLRIDAPSPHMAISEYRGGMVYPCLGFLHRLRRARVPWPRFTSDMVEFEALMNIDIDAEVLRRSIDRLVSWHKNGSENLECMEFVSGYKVPDGEYWEGRPITEEARDDFKVFRVEIGGENGARVLLN